MKAMKIEYDKDLARMNTFGMKVSCACYVEFSSEDELSDIFRNMGRYGFPQPFLHIGGGSNLLFTRDFPGTVFHSAIRFIRRVDVQGDSGLKASSGAAGQPGSILVEAGSGVLWDDFCAWCAGEGLWGPENLSGIPGEAGAAAVQNIGAYGVEVKDMVREVRCFDVVTGEIRPLHVKDCRYGYRDSIFKDTAKGRYVVTSVVFALSSVPQPRLEYGHFKNPVVPRSSYDIVENYAKSRYGADYEVPHFDAGSGFIKIPAAWLIEQCGWKGYREGNVGVYEKQPLVLVNVTGKASPDEVVTLEHKIVMSVQNLFGITLHPEVEHV